MKWPWTRHAKNHDSVLRLWTLAVTRAFTSSSTAPISVHRLQLVKSWANLTVWPVASAQFSYVAAIFSALLGCIRVVYLCDASATLLSFWVFLYVACILVAMNISHAEVLCKPEWLVLGSSRMFWTHLGILQKSPEEECFTLRTKPQSLGSCDVCDSQSARQMGSNNLLDRLPSFHPIFYYEKWRSSGQKTKTV